MKEARHGIFIHTNGLGGVRRVRAAAEGELRGERADEDSELRHGGDGGRVHWGRADDGHLRRHRRLVGGQPVVSVCVSQHGDHDGGDSGHERDARAWKRGRGRAPGEQGRPAAALGPLLPITYLREEQTALHSVLALEELCGARRRWKPPEKVMWWSNGGVAVAEI